MEKEEGVRKGEREGGDGKKRDGRKGEGEVSPNENSGYTALLTNKRTLLETTPPSLCCHCAGYK